MNEAYCALFDEKVLTNKIPEENSKLIHILSYCKQYLCNQLNDKIKYIEAIENNEETIKGIIDIFNDTANKLALELQSQKQNPHSSRFTYREVTDPFFYNKQEKLKKSKTISDLALNELGVCMGMFCHNNGSDRFVYDDIVKKLSELDKKIMDCECLSAGGGKKIVKSNGYTRFRHVFLEIGKFNSEKLKQFQS